MRKKEVAVQRKVRTAVKRNKFYMELKTTFSAPYNEN